MKEYVDLITNILDKGIDRSDRTGVGTRSVFGRMPRFDLNEGFPLLTLKKTHFKSIAYELLWMIQGGTNVRWLQKHGVTIWDKWADADGSLGPVYGAQWRTWRAPSHSAVVGDYCWHTDQIADVIHDIKTKPNSRRLLVSAWNVGDLPDMRLPPCHYAFQFSVRDGKLSCIVNMRSCDVFLGLPFNIASYALLTHMVAQVCGLGVGELVMSLADAHLYSNHLDQAKEVIERAKGVTPTLPTISLNPAITDIDSFGYDDITLNNYNPLPAIPAPVAV
jgi:thymidylate synthase